jgi:GT2 family glycosyltransferase
MNIAVVILNWNGVQLLEQFYPIIAFFQKPLFTLQIMLLQMNPSLLCNSTTLPLKSQKNNANFGFAQGYNEALKHIDAEIYALVNS